MPSEAHEVVLRSEYCGEGKRSDPDFATQDRSPPAMRFDEEA